MNELNLITRYGITPGICLGASKKMQDMSCNTALHDSFLPSYMDIIQNITEYTDFLNDFLYDNADYLTEIISPQKIAMAFGATFVIQHQRKKTKEHTLKIVLEKMLSKQAFYALYHH